MPDFPVIGMFVYDYDYDYEALSDIELGKLASMRVIVRRSQKIQLKPRSKVGLVI